MAFKKESNNKSFLFLILIIVVALTLLVNANQVINLQENIKNYFVEVARGNVEGQSTLHKFGRNPDIDTGSGFEALWNGGGFYTGFNATAAEIVEIFSTDAEDMLGGSGAEIITVYGLDANYVEISENVSLLGNIAVNTTLEYLRLHRMKIIQTGVGGSNLGQITASQFFTPGNIFAVMPIGYSQTMIAAFTIPANKTGFIQDWFASLSKKQAGFSNVRLRVRPFNETFQVKEEMTISTTGSSLVLRTYTIPKNDLPEKTDIYLEADTSVNDMGIAGGFDLILFNNS